MPTPHTALAHAIHATPWRLARAHAGITCHHAHPVYAPGTPPHHVTGFLITATLPNIPLPHALAYFHDACHFADTANAMTSASEILQVTSPDLAAYDAIVRTGFRLPWPLQDREFLHRVSTWRGPDEQGRDSATILYETVDLPDVPPWPGALRCPMAPSGQRLTDLGDGRLLLQHCMTYDLGGWIPPLVQDWAFHAGHVTAYVDEWAAAMTTLQREAREPALTVGRGVRPTRWADGS